MGLMHTAYDNLNAAAAFSSRPVLSRVHEIARGKRIWTGLDRSGQAIETHSVQLLEAGRRSSCIPGRPNATRESELRGAPSYRRTR